MNEIGKIYDSLETFLSEIVITLRMKETYEETGEEIEGDLAFVKSDTIEVLFNDRLFYPFIKELNNIILSIEGILIETFDLNNTENKNQIEQIISGLSEKIETKKAFIIKYMDDEIRAINYQIRDRDITRIIDKLTSHRNRLWNNRPSPTANEMKEERIKNSPLIWGKSKTDLLELIIALYGIKCFDNSEKNLTQKETIEIFAQFFNIEIKYADSLLSHATDRSKDLSPFLTSLGKSFDDYVKRLAKEQEDRYKGRTKF